MSKVRIFLVNNNNLAFLADCLTTIFAQDYEEYSVTFIDNGSTDDSVSFVRENFPQAGVVHHVQNIGDYKAINDLIIGTKEEYIAILKADAIVETDWLRECVKVMAGDERIFSVSPTVLYQHNPTRVKQAGVGYTLGGTAFPLHSGRNVNKLKEKEVFACGDCGVLFRKAVFQNLDGYDEKYFAIGGDLDISWRAMKKGYKNVICPTAFLIRLADTSLIDNDTKYRLEERNNYWSIYKNAPLWQKIFLGWCFKWGRGSRKRLAKNSRRASRQGVVEGKATAKRMCRKTRSGRGVKIMLRQVKWSFVNLVRFPK